MSPPNLRKTHHKIQSLLPIFIQRSLEVLINCRSLVFHFHMLISETLCNKINNIILHCGPPKHLYILIPSGWFVNHKLCSSANITDLMASSSGNHMRPWYLTCPYSSIEKNCSHNNFSQKLIVYVICSLCHPNIFNQLRIHWSTAYRLYPTGHGCQFANSSTNNHVFGRAVPIWVFLLSKSTKKKTEKLEKSAFIAKLRKIYVFSEEITIQRANMKYTVRKMIRQSIDIESYMVIRSWQQMVPF